MASIFKQIIDNKLPAYRIKENNNFIAILDAFPKEPGHTLIIPKEESKNISEMSKVLKTKIFEFIDEVVIILKDKLDFNDFFLRTNCGSLADQVVFHTHIHIVPKYSETNKKKLSIEEIAKKLNIIKK